MSVRLLIASLTVWAVLTPGVVRGQTAGVPGGAGGQSAASKPAQQEFRVQDGGTREVLESIVIPPKADAPFTLTLQTEAVRTLYDGGTITEVNQRKIARDSKGRIYQ